MAKVSLTYDGFQHATSVQEERENARGKTVATDCPYTGKGGDRIGAIDLTFTMARNYTAKERLMLERAADACPIKHSFHPDTKITVQYIYPR